MLWHLDRIIMPEEWMLRRCNGKSFRRKSQRVTCLIKLTQKHHRPKECKNSRKCQTENYECSLHITSRLTKKAEPPPTRDVNRDSGTASANGGWLRRLVRRLVSHINHLLFLTGKSHSIMPSAFMRTFGDKRESLCFCNLASAACSLAALDFGFLFINMVARSRLT